MDFEIPTESNLKVFLFKAGNSENIYVFVCPSLSNNNDDDDDVMMTMDVYRLTKTERRW